MSDRSHSELHHSHHHYHARHDHSARAIDTQKVTLVGMVVDIFLGIAKITVGIMAHSHALIADGIHSFTDAATDVMVILITRVSHMDPDEDHPYGHGKFETLGTVILGSALIAVAGAMAYDSAYRLLFMDIDVTPEWPALLIASLSIISKEWIYHYTLRAGKRLNSELLIANAWHSRTDALSSIVVLLALIGAMAGYLWLDAVATIIIAIVIGKIGWSLAWDSLKELLETSVPKQQVDEFMAVILAVEGVKDCHSLRARHVGPDIILDVHIQVAPTISVSEGHQISNAVMLKLRESNELVTDITLHIDAEEDLLIAEQIASVKSLPDRIEIEETLHRRWQDLIASEQILNIQIHYLQRKVFLEVMLALPARDKETRLLEDLNSKTSDLPWLESIKYWIAPAFADDARPVRQH